MENKLPECMVAFPTVFAVGENYNIFIPFSAEVLVKIRVAGKLYYLTEGTWTLEEDGYSYAGDISFSVSEDGDYTFKKN